MRFLRNVGNRLLSAISETGILTHSHTSWYSSLSSAGVNNASSNASTPPRHSAVKKYRGNICLIQYIRPLFSVIRSTYDMLGGGMTSSDLIFTYISCSI